MNGSPVPVLSCPRCKEPVKTLPDGSHYCRGCQMPVDAVATPSRNGPRPNSPPSDVAGKPPSHITQSTGATLPDVVETFRRWLLMPDPGGLHFALAVVAGHWLGGDPVWGLMVASPAGSKTEIIRSLESVPGVYPLSELTARTFASGLQNDDMPGPFSYVASRGPRRPIVASRETAVLCGDAPEAIADAANVGTGFAMVLNHRIIEKPSNSPFSPAQFDDCRQCPPDRCPF